MFVFCRIVDGASDSGIEDEKASPRKVSEE